MLSVLFATRNRAALLPSVLESFTALAAPPGGWELVVVDNGSSDDSRAVAESFRDRLPLICLVEPVPGKNAALNTGLAAASGDLVVLTDDDVYPRPDWLVELRAVADDHPDFAVFGGAVLPRWEVPPPDWVVDWVPAGPVFTITDPALPEGPVEPWLVFGPNMAVREAVFRVGHRFDPSIGPSGPHYAMGSETEFVVRVCKAGYEAWHCTRAVVEHFVRRSQLERSWILGRAFRAGRGQYRLAMLDEPTPAALRLGAPPWLLRSYLRSLLELPQARFSRNPRRMFDASWNHSFLRGQIVEARQMHGRPR